MTVRFAAAALAASMIAGTLAVPAYAEPQSVRWTGAEDKDADLAHVLARLNSETGLRLTEADFKLGEDRDLAFNHYRRYDQIVTNVEVRNMAIRVWTTAKNELIQLEAKVDGEGARVGVIEMESATDLAREGAALLAARDVVKAHADSVPRDIKAKPFWDAGKLVFGVTVKARRGVHHVTVDALTLEIVSSRYELYPRGDAPAHGPGEFSVPAYVFPVYEEYKTEKLAREHRTLKYLKRSIALPSGDPYETLRGRRYPWSKQDSVKGETPEGQAAGFWSMQKLRRDAKVLHDAIPSQPNGYRTGARLVGRYATINIYPDAFTKFPGVTLPMVPSSELMFQWSEIPDADDWEVTPRAAALGKTFSHPRDILVRDAVRDPNHNAAVYINNGFDEVQVYFAINEMFDALRPMGFTDPDLAERPFHAFLFDPDIESQDNAYYTDDTINFTTYTPSQLNMARDNTTIWHELGHGVMDRLMGNQLNLADTGGLSEGMADFVAEMVLQARTGGKAFPGIEDQRIINRTGFFLTNEVHDDGEAYGGTMKDILDLAIQQRGRAGLEKVVDLVLESMRLCRDHPGLTAEDWFSHMKFADSLGRRGVRRPGELTAIIDQALNSRNFAPEAERGGFEIKHRGEPVVAGGPGSRGNEIELTLAPDAVHEEQLVVELKDGLNFHYDFPVEVRIFYNSGPLQGAIDWIGEDQEPEIHVINSLEESLALSLKVKGTCDQVNRQDGSCSDFAYVQIWNKGATKPVAKKRFYLDIKNP